MKKMALVGLAVIFGMICNSALAAYCHGKPHNNWVPNTNPIYTGAPTFVREVPNGKLYLGGAGDHQFRIAHVYGSAYEMGLAHGQLLRDELIDFVPAVWTYLETAFEDDDDLPSWIPPEIAKYIAEYGLDAFLDFTEIATKSETPQYWFDEMQGIADGVNNSAILTMDRIWKLSLFGELSKGTCSMFGAWGDAIANVPNLGLLQLRALDWNTDGPFPLYPTIVVYHPNEGHAFANVGWPGWVSSISGMSSVQTAISEIGIYFSDASWGEESRFGYPFTYILRDLLQFDNTVDEATNRLANAKRTCDLLFGFGDGKANEFRGYQYSASVLRVYNDQNLQPLNDTWHPRIKDIVYWGMDWLCPGYNTVLSEQLTKFYGNITVQNTIQYILPAMQTGSTHALLYDLTNQYMYYSAVGLANTTDRMAYQRTFTQLDMKALFAIPPPSK